MFVPADIDWLCVILIKLSFLSRAMPHCTMYTMLCCEDNVQTARLHIKTVRL